MKKLFLLLLLIPVFSCKTTKLNVKTGDRKDTWNTRQLKRSHPYGFKAAGKYIHYPEQKRQTVTK